MDGGIKMTKKTSFSVAQIEELEKNPHILKVSEKQLTYQPDFKIKAVKENIQGKSPSEIFMDSGFDLDLIGKDIPRKRLYIWRKVYDESGDLGFLFENRGKSVRKTSSEELSVEEKLKKAEAKIKFLEAENGFLKKLEELERQALKRKRN